MSDYLQKLFIDEAKAVLFKGGTGGGGDVSDEDIATDEEVGDVIDDIFSPEGTGDSSIDDVTGEPGEGNIATDEEVGDVIDNVFG